MQSEELNQRIIGAAEAIDGFAATAEEEVGKLNDAINKTTDCLNNVVSRIDQLESDINDITKIIINTINKSLDDSTTKASDKLGKGILSAAAGATKAAETLTDAVDNSKIEIGKLTANHFWILLAASVIGSFLGSALMLFLYLNWPR